MADRKQYYKLDEIGFLGTQQKVPSFVRKRVEKKTGEIFEAARRAKANGSFGGTETKTKKAS